MKSSMTTEKAMSMGFNPLDSVEQFMRGLPIGTRYFARDLKRPVCTELWTPSRPTRIERRIKGISISRDA